MFKDCFNVFFTEAVEFITCFSDDLPATLSKNPCSNWTGKPQIRLLRIWFLTANWILNPEINWPKSPMWKHHKEHKKLWNPHVWEQYLKKISWKSWSDKLSIECPRKQNYPTTNRRWCEDLESGREHVFEALCEDSWKQCQILNLLKRSNYETKQICRKWHQCIGTKPYCDPQDHSNLGDNHVKENQVTIEAKKHGEHKSDGTIWISWRVIIWHNGTCWRLSSKDAQPFWYDWFQGLYSLFSARRSVRSFLQWKAASDLFSSKSASTPDRIDHLLSFSVGNIPFNKIFATIPLRILQWLQAQLPCGCWMEAVWLT
jgi:hypothetical protein